MKWTVAGCCTVSCQPMVATETICVQPSWGKVISLPEFLNKTTKRLISKEPKSYKAKLNLNWHEYLETCSGAFMKLLNWTHTLFRFLLGNNILSIIIGSFRKTGLQERVKKTKKIAYYTIGKIFTGCFTRKGRNKEHKFADELWA